MGPSAPGRFPLGSKRPDCHRPAVLVNDSVAAGFTLRAAPSIVTVNSELEAGETACPTWSRPGPTVIVKPSIFCVWTRSSLVLVHAASIEAVTPGVRPSMRTQYAELYR